MLQMQSPTPDTTAVHMMLRFALRCRVCHQSRLEPQCEGRHPQRAGIACFDFISGPAAFVGGVPLTRAKNPWAMPELSTKRPQIFPCELIPLSDVKADPG
jgi:hypothetical protein